MIEDDCIEWDGTLFSNGYGYITPRYQGDSPLVHRRVWEEVNGTIPKSMCICHHCDNPPCINVDHLFIGSKRDNALDMMSKGRNVAPNKLKTHCIRGHELSGDNLRKRKDEYRDCRECYKRRKKEAYHAKKEML